MDGDTFHPASEFGQFPWNRADEKWFKSFTGIPKGGVNQLAPHAHYFAFYRDDGTADVWELPTYLAAVLCRQFDDGYDSMRRQFCSLLNGHSK